MKRLFIAIPLPEKRKLEVLQLFPSKNFQGVRWVSIENLHITAHFLGATPDEKLNDVIHQGKLICETFPSFILAFESFKIILKDRKPVMIWAQFSESKSFNKLSYSFRERFPTEEKRNPLPHLTLARIKQLRRLPFELPQANSFSFEVRAIELWESHLNSNEAIYERIEQWNLATSPRTN